MTPSNDISDTNRQLLPFRESLLPMIGIACVAMLVAMDQTIVGTALPRIVADLKGFDLYAWVATSYMLASLLAIPIFGRLGDIFGRKPYLLAAVFIFTGASFMCGMANMHAVSRAFARAAEHRRRHPDRHGVRHRCRVVPRPETAPAMAGVRHLASRDHLGAATALLQSLRTLGGMLGTVMTGALLGKLYAHGVYRSLDAYQATQWFKSFASPTVLVNRAEQAALINRLIVAGHSGGRMMHAAREALINSIHVGLIVAAAAALAGLCLAWFVPPVRVCHTQLDAGTD